MITFLTGLDGQRIIIYGGAVSASGYSDALYELNLTNYKWYAPKTSGKIPKPRFYHKANVIGKYMVISFGKYNTLYIYIYFIQKKLIILTKNNHFNRIWL
jgi:hypothetical protein